MSEEYGLKFVVNGEDYDKIKKSLNEQIEDLQQKVEQLENIRKEATEYINHATIGADSSPVEDSWLYNLYETRHILNKGDNKWNIN